jgi:hypothetical protein
MNALHKVVPIGYFGDDDNFFLMEGFTFVSVVDDDLLFEGGFEGGRSSSLSSSSSDESHKIVLLCFLDPNDDFRGELLRPTSLSLSLSLVSGAPEAVALIFFTSGLFLGSGFPSTLDIVPPGVSFNEAAAVAAAAAGDLSSEVELLLDSSPLFFKEAFGVDVTLVGELLFFLLVALLFPAAAVKKDAISLVFTTAFFFLAGVLALLLEGPLLPPAMVVVVEEIVGVKCEERACHC